MASVLLAISGYISRAIDFLLGLPSLVQFILGLAGAAIPVAKFLSWLNRRQTIQSIEQSSEDPDAPRLDPERPVKVFKPSGPTVWDRLSTLGDWARATVQRSDVEYVELSRADDTAETAYMVAINRAAEVYGLTFLPPRIQNPVQLEIARRYLEDADAPTRAIQRAQTELEEVDTGPLFTQLFSEAVLNDVDLTPELGDSPDYFTKYFQPLLIAFSEREFVESAGEPPGERKKVLVEHLKHVSDGRVKAALFRGEGPVVRPDELKEHLPKPVPGGYNQQRKRAAKKFNRNECCRGLLFVAELDRLDAARLSEKTVNDRLDSVNSLEYARWTPDIDRDPPEACFLWQAR